MSYGPNEILLLEHVGDRLHTLEAELGVHAAALELLGHTADARGVRNAANALERPATQTATAAKICLQQLADQVREHMQDEGEPDA